MHLPSLFKALVELLTPNQHVLELLPFSVGFFSIAVLINDQVVSEARVEAKYQRRLRESYIAQEAVLKQVLVIRKDLKMRRGKEIAQGGHASWWAALQDASVNHANMTIKFSNPFVWEWLFNKRSAKICVTVDSLEELAEVLLKAKAVGVPWSVVKDAGLTEFHGVETYTAIGVGPERAELIDQVTAGLKLY